MATESAPVVTLYWLNKSRSHRILWMLEELKVPYELKVFKRGSDMLAPKELKDVHPLGKSPVLGVRVPGQEKELIIAESALIVEYLAEHFGKQLIPTQWQEGKENALGGETEQFLRYRYYMHYAEGSFVTLLLINLFTMQIKNAPVPFFIKPITRTIAGRVESAFLTRNLEQTYSYLESQLAASPEGGEFFSGKTLTGADIMMIYPLEVAISGAGLTKEKCPKLVAYVDRIHEREAYKAAIKKVEDVTGEKFSMEF